MLNDRQGEILNKLIREYISLVRPISSQLLEEKYGFGVSPATIRNEMQKLTDSGYLYQPHTSAGRVPTDKGYRFFVDQLLKSELRDFKSKEWLFEEREDVAKFVRILTKNLAHFSGAFAFSYFEKGRFFWKEGWEEILKEPEFEEKRLVDSFVSLLRAFEENLDILEVNSTIKVYIGRENPFKKTKDFSIIVSKCCLPEASDGIISLLGPTRMAYDKNISLINSLNKLLEKI